jgi:hypothetical protein
MSNVDHRYLDLAPQNPGAQTAAFATLVHKLLRAPYESWVSFTPRSEDLTLGPIPLSRTFQVPRFNLTEALTDPYPQATGSLTQRLILKRHLRLLAEPPGLSWDAFCAAVAQLPPGQLWRHNGQGDLLGDPLCFEIAAEPLEQLIRANRGKRGFTFSHYHPQFGNNADLIATANQQGFTINLVADSFTEADELMRRQVAPVVVKVPEDAAPVLRTTAGHKVVTCPQRYRRGVTCAACTLCAQAWYRHLDRDRDIVAFPIPGLKAADLPPDVLAGMM